MTTRRELLIGAASIALVPACGTATQGGDAASGPTCASQIMGNHGHVLTVPGSQLAAPADHTYNIQGAADHTHEVALTMADLQTLATGGTVTVTSSLGAGHTHSCSVHCMG